MRPDEGALGRFLWRSARGEAAAAGVFVRAARWIGLPREDRDRVAQFAEEEITHARLFRTLARRHLRHEPVGIWPYRIEDDPLLALATIYRAERFAGASFGRMQALAAAWGDTELRAAYARITREEAGHIAWGRQFLRQADGARLACHNRARILEGYKDVARDRRWLQRSAS